MRKFILSAIALAAVTVSFAAPSQAGGYYGGYSQSYDSYDYDYRPVCRYKKIKFYDDYGYLRVKKVKVCH